MEETDPLKSVRQPLVTATGILLGFTLNIAATWVPKAFTHGRATEYLVALSLCIHIPLSIVVLYRILNANYPKDRAQAYYNKTVKIFITALSLYFILFLATLVESAIQNW